MLYKVYIYSDRILVGKCVYCQIYSILMTSYCDVTQLSVNNEKTRQFYLKYVKNGR